MFEDCADSNATVGSAQGALATTGSSIEINRSAHIFEHVLAYLIDPTYPYPKKYVNELKYYLVPYTLSKLHDPSEKLFKIIDTIDTDIKDLTSKIDEIDSYTGKLMDKLKDIEYELEQIKKHTDTDEQKCCHDNCRDNALRSVACEDHLNKCSHEGHNDYTGQYGVCYEHCEANEKYCDDHRNEH